MAEEKKAKHVGIILDGNRRFAKRLMLEPWRGHELGFEKLKKIYEWCKELDIKELTLYCFSMQNFDRPKIEFDYLMDIFERAGNEAAEDPAVHANKIRFRLAGRPWLFPERVQKALNRAVEATKNYNDFVINLCFAYGGREEIMDGMKKMLKDIKEGKIKGEYIEFFEKTETDVKDIKADDAKFQTFFSKYLDIGNDLDIIIRTGGDKRTSNFLPWQSIYAELFFLDKFWPEFEKEDLIKVLEEYGQRERRFGK
ncbi:MAG: polyprenyl diphosphate synthase [Candidatus Pacearchaeota archaeon]